MSKKTRPSQSRVDELFVRADREVDRGRFKAAFRLFLAGAKMGDIGCQLNLGNFYADGQGVGRNLSAALKWYKLAYRRGNASAARNIGVTWRDEKKHRRALVWFKKAVRLGDEGANLEIAKHYMANDKNPARAISYLEKVCRSNRVSEAGMEQARALLRRARDGSSAPIAKSPGKKSR